MPIGVVGAIIGASVVGAGATLIASHDASSAASNAAQQNNALQAQIYQSNEALAQPYISAGDTANNALMGFLGLGGDPAATQQAFQDYLNSTGYQFALNQGINAAEQDKAAAGMLNSGATLSALDAYGTGLAQQYGQQYVNNLGGVANRGQSAASGLAGVGQNYANAVSNNNNSAASASGNAALATGNAINSLIGSGLNAYGLSTGMSSYGGASGGGYNAFAPNIGG